MRAGGWSALGLDTDPTPGDVDGVRRASVDFRGMSRTAKDVGDVLDRLANDLGADVWAGAAGTAFRASVRGTAIPVLGIVVGAFDEAESALSRWADALDDAQRQADHALHLATDAQRDIERLVGLGSAHAAELEIARATVDASVPGSQGERDARRGLNVLLGTSAANSAALDDARARHARALRSLEPVLEDYRRTATVVARDLRAARDTTRPADPIEPTLWDDVGNGALDALGTVGNGVLSFGNAMIQHPEYTGQLIGGLLLADAGGAMEAGGVALDATVVGIPGGAALHVAGVEVIVTGAALAISGAAGLALNAVGDDAVSPWDSGRVARSREPSAADDAREKLTELRSREGKKPPKNSPKFRAPTHKPQEPPELDSLPDGQQLRVMPPTEQYPHGYWVVGKPLGDGKWQALIPGTGKTGRRWETHVPLPAPRGSER